MVYYLRIQMSQSLALLACLLAVPALAQSSSEQPSSVSTFYGAFTHAEPIAVPLFRGLEPSLRLSYSSAGSSGLAGVGWGLEGLSVIERAGAGRGTPRYDGSDVFLLDGQELVACPPGSPSPSCTTGGTHATRIESYQRLRYDGASNTWTVWSKEGIRRVYTPVFQAFRWGGFVGTYRWGLTSVVDTRGNTVSYGWWCDGSPAQDCYPDTVSYNGTVVRLYREARPDPVTFANGSTTLGRTNFRLKAVDVVTGGARVRAYRLNYVTSGSTGRSLLASVQQFGSDAQVDGAGNVWGGTALPPVSYGWQAGAHGFNWSVSSGVVDWGYQSGRAWVDFNGDGRADYCRVVGNTNGSSSYVSCTVSTGTGFGPTYSSGVIDWGYESGRAWVDFNGDGRADYCRVVGNTNGSSSHVSCTVSTGTGFGPTYSSGVIDWGYESGRSWADFNGDGRADYCRRVGHTNGSSSYVSCTVSTGTGFGPTYSSGVIDWGYETGRQWADFDGDGRADYCRVVGNTNGSSSHVSCTVSTGTGFGPTYSSGVIDWGYESGRQWADFNGDGKADYCRVVGNTNGSSSHVSCTVSTGTGFDATYNSGVIDWGYESGREWTDFDGDGRADYCRRVGHTNGSSSYVSCTLSMGTGFGATHGSGVVDWGYDSGRQWADFDGNGKSDFCRVVGNTNGSSSYAACTPTSGAVPDLLTSVTSSMGGTTTVQYTPSSAWSNTYLPVGAVLQTVSSVQSCDGRGNCSQTGYSYQGGLWSSSERRFLGFRKVTSVLDAAGNYTETFYHQHVGCISKPEVTYYRDAAGRLYQYSTFGYTESASPPYTSLMTDRWEFECNQTGTCRRTLLQIGYDQYGNGFVTYEHGDFDVAGDERTSLRGLYPNTSAYIVGLPAYENIYAGIGMGGALLKQTLHGYDGNTTYAAAPTQGLLTRQWFWNNQTGGYTTRSFGYDAWGNRIRETDARGASITIGYDSTYRVYETSRCNALGQCSYKTWHAGRDLVANETDLNGGVTLYAHDVLGRPLQTSLPNGSWESYAYLDWGNPSWQRVRRTTSDGTADGLWTEVYQDGLGRKYRMVKEGGLTQDTQYNDGSTRVWRQSAWYGPGETPQYQVFAYDGLGRLRTAINPDGTVGQRAYGNGHVVTYNELGHERVVWTDAYGQMTQVREKNGASYHYTTYQYNLLGNLTRVTNAAGNATTVTWDSLGRKLASCDPDTGCTSYTYDDGGLMLSRRDAKGQTITFAYDALGRPLTKTYPDGRQVRWTYDEPGRGASRGALTTVVDPSGSESRTYDSAGRVTTVTKCVSALCYTLTSSYDAAGRLASVRYPDGEVVPYTYDASGRLRSVGGYVTGFNYNGRDQIVSATYANGTTASFSYSDARQWLLGATVSGPEGTLYQAGYQYDAAGRVRSTSSTTHSLSNLSYTYDELSRLTGVSGGQSQSFAYDAVGNMTWNSQVGGYTYGAAQRHAVSAAGGQGYSYDAVGNMLTGGGRTLEWDAENRLVRATTASGTTTYAYDAGGQRVARSGPSGTTYTFGSLVEFGPQGLTKYYHAGPLLVAKRDSTGAYWYHQDHLGSVRLLTNSAGRRVASYDYSAFGAPVASSSSVANSHGYGGHVTDDTGLVYMNARYYDPRLGRFLSPDSLVPSAEDPQALNRYAYVYNNPISNMDPTGHVPVVAAVFTAVSVGATVGFTSTAFIIATVGAATMTAGYVLKDPLLMSIGGVLLGASSGFAFGAGFLGGAGTAQAAWVGGTVSALTSPISPLDSKLKQVIGWAYTAQNLFHEFKNMQETVEQGADKMKKLFDEEGVSNFVEAQKQRLSGNLSADQLELLNNPNSAARAQDLYGKALSRLTGGRISAAQGMALDVSGGLVGPGNGWMTAVLDNLLGWIPGMRVHAVLHDLGGELAVAAGVRPGYLYLGKNWLGMAFDNKLAGQVEGIFITSGRSFSSLLQRAY